ncbi:nuclear transport factor 2 family protein [Frondihabitans australicus]|uniref:SnoaL-like protein n=1 Tax=Frondihabitans australicus TaxID=386892 RepID=A0A495IHF8_9MICO|nr:nuclear transport factor 2 family protein [Frondihabitans australicus]RKR74516.1 SnoaL-like protein [Frondihabitans australicus]
MTVETPRAIRTFIDTTNEEDTEGFLAAFADDATLDDWGRVFHGTSGVASWNQTDNIGKHSRFDVVEVAEGAKPGEFVVTVDVTGEGYNGLGTMTFTVEGDLVKSLVIT